MKYKQKNIIIQKKLIILEQIKKSIVTQLSSINDNRDINIIYQESTRLKEEKSNSILMNYLNEDFTQSLHSKQLELDKKLKMYIKLAESEYKKKILKIDKNSEKFLIFG